MSSLFYAGVGSTTTPNDICNLMTFIGKILMIGGYTLNSGAADGADSAFEKGVLREDRKQIFLPYKGFNGSESELYLDNLPEDLVKVANDLVFKYHPNPYALMRKGGFGMKAMKRNSFQVLGLDLSTPVDFVVCWTSNGLAKGGTGHAIRIATDRGIPVYNLYTKSEYEELYSKYLRPILLEKFQDELNDFNFSYDELLKTLNKDDDSE